jgi:hypothetical protein
MKGSDRTVLVLLPVVALIAAFWFLLLSPKREEASKLDTEIVRLQDEVQAAEQEAEFAEQAREDFADDYRKVVTLGKAVPQDDDTASLFAQLSGVADASGVRFTSLELDSAGESGEATGSPATTAASPAAEPSTTAPAEEPTQESSGSGSTEESAGGAPTTTTDSAAPADPATATEATAAALPIGAAVGPAGLPVMPYKLSFRGDFFHVADFVRGLDSGVSTADGKVKVDGRLLTVDGFSLARDTELGFPHLIADFSVTTYVTPEAQGLTAGATPSGPAPVSAPSSGYTVDTASAEVAP